MNKTIVKKKGETRRGFPLGESRIQSSQPSGVALDSYRPRIVKTSDPQHRDVDHADQGRGVATPQVGPSAGGLSSEYSNDGSSLRGVHSQAV